MASQKQRVLDALRTHEPAIRKAFEAVIAGASAGVDMAQLEALLKANRMEDAVRLLRLDQSMLWPLHEAIRNTFMAGGALASDIAPRGLRGVFGFDGRHYRAEQWVSQNVGELIEGITRDSIESTRRVILSGLQEGRSSRAVAREITGRQTGRKRVGGYLGLNSNQTDSIISGRAKLASGDPKLMREYLNLELRNKRFDGSIKKAIREGRAITGKQLDRIIEAHRFKALGYRGRVIAKDQSHTALAAGREEGFQQLIDSGRVSKVTARWQHNLSEKPRRDHVAMSGTVIEVGQRFEFPDDTRMKHPHDPVGGGRHSLGCRCIAVYRIHVPKD